MRERPKGYNQAASIQAICAATDRRLGRSDLTVAPALLSGFSSVLEHPACAPIAGEAWSLRQLGMDAASEARLRRAALSSLEAEGNDQPDLDHAVPEPPYEINIADPNLSFRRRVAADDPAVDDLLGLIAAPLPDSLWTTRPLDSARGFGVPLEAGRGAGTHLRMRLPDAVHVAPAPRFDLARTPAGPIEVTWADLEAVAAAWDEIDRATPERRALNWATRLREVTGEQKVLLLRPEPGCGGLGETDRLRLDGLRHLIGLPGSGKSTLISLLLGFLDARGYRAVALLPSIEASLNLIDELRRYRVGVGLLVGQSPRTRAEHAAKFAQRIAALDEGRGLGRSAPGADLMATGCALAGFVDDEEDFEAFPLANPPCASLRQRALKADGTEAEREGPRLCPLGGGCGRLRAARGLVGASIWIGHVLSLDTRPAPHFADARLTFLEMVARTADVVIVDEVDGAQSVLDAKAVAALDLTGADGSADHRLTQTLFEPLASGRISIARGNVANWATGAAWFADLNRRLVLLLHQEFKREGQDSALARFQELFVTGNRVLAELFMPDLEGLAGDERERAHLEANLRHEALQLFWDSAVRQSLLLRTEYTESEVTPIDPSRLAEALGRPAGEIEAAGEAIAGALRDYLNETMVGGRALALRQVRERLFAFVPPRADLTPQQANVIADFLTVVTTVVMQFQSLVPAQDAMVADGVLDAPLFRDGLSEDVARLLPESLVGRLTGLRFFHEDTRGAPGERTIRLQFMRFRGTPRLLLYRLHEMLRHEGRPGPAVLLASATSFLEASPSYHVDVGPHYILRRAEESGDWRDSRWIFAPVRDPEQAGQFLRFSGARPGRRDRVLELLADHYFGGQHPIAVEMGRDFDDGRRVGFVVNSYEQVRLFKRRVASRHGEARARRLIGVVDRVPDNTTGDWIVASQVERLGDRTDWDAIIFPLRALARGVNIVFSAGARVRDAALGTMVFLTRPHPATDSLDFATGLIGQRSAAFDLRELDPRLSVEDVIAAWGTARAEAIGLARQMLRYPLMASRLGPLGREFSADIMVDVLQCIGRAMRNGCRARVIFADAAWAPRSALGERDTRTSSMLLMMRSVLQDLTAHPDPVRRAVYAALYEPFLFPLRNCVGVRDAAAVDTGDFDADA